MNLNSISLADVRPFTYCALTALNVTHYCFSMARAIGLV